MFIQQISHCLAILIFQKEKGFYFLFLFYHIKFNFNFKLFVRVVYVFMPPVIFDEFELAR